MATFFNGWTEEQLETFINQTYNGHFTPSVLPVNLYNATVDKLTEAIFEGFGGSFSKFPEDLPAGNLLAHFEHNIQVFSGAKTHEEIVTLTDAIFDEDGFRRSFSQFRQDAIQLHALRQEHWLRAEFDTAANNAFSGRQWLDIEENAEALPLLEYQTAGDERVRPEHVDLDSIVKPVGDPFWNTHFPPNGWRCRCTVIQHEEGEKRITPDERLPPIDEVEPLFRMNAGRDKFIFDETKHPYFTNVSERFRPNLDRNFDFPTRQKPG